MSIKQQLAGGVSILDAADGLYDGKSLRLAIVGLLIYGAIMMGSGALLRTSTTFAAIVAFIAFLWLIAVFNAVGLQSMLMAKQHERLNFIEAYVGGLIMTPKFIVLLIVIVLAFIGLLLATALVYAVCKIPGIGPVLYTVVWPISVLLLGVATFGLFYIALPLCGPALWDGRGITGAMGQLIGIARVRAVMVIVLFVLLGLLMSIVAGFVAFVLASGITVSTTLVASVLGSAGSSVNPLGILTSMASFFMSAYSGSGDGYGIAMAVGGIALVAVSGGAVSLVFLRGICLIYLQTSSGLETSEEAAQIAGAVNSTKERFSTVAAKVQKSVADASAKTASGPISPTSAPTSKPESTAALCPKCGSNVGFDDMFCESCGYKLK
jgi:hypothetical protein